MPLIGQLPRANSSRMDAEILLITHVYNPILNVKETQRRLPNAHNPHLRGLWVLSHGRMAFEGSGLTALKGG